MKFNKLFVPVNSSLLCLALVLGIFNFGCSNNKAANVILITVDTLRADHLSSYGYFRPTSPNIDRIAKEGVRFDNAIAQSSWTLPSVASILASKLPLELGMVHAFSKFRPDSPRVASILKQNNYNTGAFVSGGFVTAGRGFDKGFETFKQIGGRAEEINKHVFDWLDQERSKPFFLWVHYFDVHSDYDAPSPFDKLFDEKFSNLEIGKTDYLINVIKNETKLSPIEVEKIKILYDRGIKYTDFHIGRLTQKLRDKKLLEETVVIIGSDHGEEFMDHDRVLHTLTLYDELVKTPLIIRFPGELPQGKVVFDQVQNLDILPTIFDLLKIKDNFNFRGRSLVPLMQGKKGNENFSFSETNQLSFGKVMSEIGFILPKKLYRSLFMIRSNKEKLIYNISKGTYEMFDLIKDPDEKINIYAENKKFRETLKKELDLLLKSIKNTSSKSETLELRQKDIDKLRSLGYMQ